MRGARAVRLVGLAVLAVARPAAGQTAAAPVRAARIVGRPSAAALASAQVKQLVMREPEGPESVVLNVDEVASLIAAGLDPVAGGAVESIEVRLDPGRIAFDAYLLNTAWDTVLGSAARVLGSRERVSVAGPARAVKAGVVAWEPDSLVVRRLTLPRAAIPYLINQLTGGKDGTVPIAVPPTVRQIRIWPFGVSFSRRAS